MGTACIHVSLCLAAVQPVSKPVQVLTVQALKLLSGDCTSPCTFLLYFTSFPFKLFFLYLIVSRSQLSKILHVLVASIHLSSIPKKSISLFFISNTKCSILLEWNMTVFHSCLMDFLFFKFNAIFEWMLRHKTHLVIVP